MIRFRRQIMLLLIQLANDIFCNTETNVAATLARKSMQNFDIFDSSNNNNYNGLTLSNNSIKTPTSTSTTTTLSSVLAIDQQHQQQSQLQQQTIDNNLDYLSNLCNLYKISSTTDHNETQQQLQQQPKVKRTRHACN